jgi:hypothetical protein
VLEHISPWPDPQGLASLVESRCKPMGLSELERLVDDAERDGVIRRSLRRCRSRAELVLAARRLGYGIQRIDLRSAWLLHQREQSVVLSVG